MPYTVKVRTTFDAGHRLLGYDGRCISPHGHTYQVELAASADTLDSGGMLIDFGLLKRTLRSWLDQNWDHAFLANPDDLDLITAIDAVPGARLFVLPSGNPTVENLTRILHDAMHTAVGDGIASVGIWETGEQGASYTPAPADVDVREAPETTVTGDAAGTGHENIDLRTASSPNQEEQMAPLT